MTTVTHPLRQARSATPRLVDEPGIRFAIAEGVLATCVLAAGLLAVPTVAELWVVAAVALAGGFVLVPAAAVGLGASAWACWTGFLDHDLGTLTLAGADRQRLLVLVLVSLVGVATRTAFGLMRTGHHE